MTRRFAHLSRLQRMCGFTLIEVLLSLAVSSVAGLLVTFMLAGVCSSTSTANDTRQAVMSNQVAGMRIGSLMRAAAVVLAKDATRIVLWTGDVNTDSKPNLSELRYVAWNPLTNEIRTAESPATLDPSLDETFELSADFLTEAGSRSGTAAFPERVTMQDVTQWEVALDHTDVRLARLIRVNAVVVSESGNVPVAAISALRVGSGAS